MTDKILQLANEAAIAAFDAFGVNTPSASISYAFIVNMKCEDAETDQEYDRIAASLNLDDKEFSLFISAYTTKIADLIRSADPQIVSVTEGR